MWVSIIKPNYLYTVRKLFCHAKEQTTHKQAHIMGCCKTKTHVTAIIKLNMFWGKYLLQYLMPD